MVFWILSKIITMVQTVIGAVFYLILSPFSIANTPAQRQQLDPYEAAQLFAAEFESNHGSVHPDFYLGGYLQALEKARVDLQFLVVILQTDEHDDTSRFNSTTLGSERLKRFLEEHNILVWAGNVRYAEAYQVSKRLKATSYPFVATIALKQARNGSMNMGIIDAIEGFATVEKLIAHLAVAVDRHSSSLERIRNERAQQNASRAIREEQDSAYLASLRADQEKERRAREEAEAKKRAAERAKKEKERRQKLAKKQAQWRRWALTQLPAEPSEGETDVAKLSFRLADGGRVVRRFKATDSVEMVYTFVDTYYTQKEARSSKDVSKPPRDYNHTFDFLLISPYPRTVHHSDSQKAIKDERGLWPSASLVVEMSASDEDA